MPPTRKVQRVNLATAVHTIDFVLRGRCAGEFVQVDAVVNQLARQFRHRDARERPQQQHD